MEEKRTTVIESKTCVAVFHRLKTREIGPALIKEVLEFLDTYEGYETINYQIVAQAPPGGAILVNEKNVAAELQLNLILRKPVDVTTAN